MRSCSDSNSNSSSNSNSNSNSNIYACLLVHLLHDKYITQCLFFPNTSRGDEQYTIILLINNYLVNMLLFL